MTFFLSVCLLWADITALALTKGTPEAAVWAVLAILSAGVMLANAPTPGGQRHE